MNERCETKLKIIVNSISLMSIIININKLGEFSSNLHYKDSLEIYNKYVGYHFDFMKSDPLRLK